MDIREVAGCGTFFRRFRGWGVVVLQMYYAIEDYEEAKAYIENAVTNAHLREISEALLQLESDDATRVMGWPDDLKLRSSMTLFALAAKENEVFRKYWISSLMEN